MTWLEIAGYLFKLVGQVLELKSKNQLTQAQLDAAVNALHAVPPPKEAS